MIKRFIIQLAASIVLGMASIAVGILHFDPMFWITVFILYNVCEIAAWNKEKNK
ncbi:hypothetical protein SAMN02745975_03584 [Geosporobacter subterraneus DSM 17957]|uniref:Uncharacterized protein n=1 Tax=Geosporobacter subterraneus DSM 17957 TaxID=1121919 RepID=A0A1M6PHN2_9FIRM|nr:hypothetical protein [Geosporobacter subterraneus]SHK07459.1 hypothetical protein SAMN02745975_03584 [Geosporobacter subterraneus DSM 17957]